MQSLTVPAGPYVTAVGGTTGVNPEVAASLSSGGFSNYFARPSYQSTAVSNFITSIGTKYSGLYKCVHPLAAVPRARGIMRFDGC